MRSAVNTIQPKGGSGRTGGLGSSRDHARIHRQMTYTHKLARRLALSRNLAMFPALLLAAACAGETTAPEAPANPTSPSAPTNDVGFRVLPGTVTVEVNQRIRFRGEFRSFRGMESTPSLRWEASGGTIDSRGTFSSDKPGTFRVIGRGIGRGRGTHQRPDTSVVVVVPRQPDMLGLRVTPRAPRLQPGQRRGLHGHRSARRRTHRADRRDLVRDRRYHRRRRRVPRRCRRGQLPDHRDQHPGHPRRHRAGPHPPGRDARHDRRHARAAAGTRAEPDPGDRQGRAQAVDRHPGDPCDPPVRRLRPQRLGRQRRGGRDLPGQWRHDHRDRSLHRRQHRGQLPGHRDLERPGGHRAGDPRPELGRRRSDSSAGAEPDRHPARPRCRPATACRWASSGC